MLLNKVKLPSSIVCTNILCCQLISDILKGTHCHYSQWIAALLWWKYTSSISWCWARDTGEWVTFRPLYPHVRKCVHFMDSLVGLTRWQRKILRCHWKSIPDFLVEQYVSWSVYQLSDPVRTELSRLVVNHCYVSVCNAIRNQTIFTPRTNLPPGGSVPNSSWNCITIPSDGPCFRKQLLHNRLRHKRYSFVMRTEIYTTCARPCLTFISIYLHQILLNMPHKICTAVKQRLHPPASNP